MRWIVFGMLLLAAPATAQLEWRGFAEYALSARTDGESELPLHEARVQLAGDLYSTRSEAHFALDALADRVTKEEQLELREAFLRLDLFGRHAELRAGRQPITWGTGDLVFIHDVFPKDFESFFLGRDDPYLKRPVDALRTTAFFASSSWDLVWMPSFSPDRLPSPDRLGVPSPPEPVEPQDRLSDGELASRLARPFGSWELALYGFVGRARQPIGSDASGARGYPQQELFGFSGRGTLRGGILWLESGRLTRAREDEWSTAPQQWMHMGGYERGIWSDATLNAQAQWIQPDQGAEDRWLLTSRFEQLLKSQTLRLSLFAFFSPTDEDGLLRSALAYDIEDGLRMTLGAHVFFGEQADTPFGYLRDVDLVFLRMRRMF